MPTSVCPMDVVRAPVGVIWSILTDSTRYSEWSDLGDFQDSTITPPGPTTPGQVLEGQTSELGLTFRVRLVVREVNLEHHRVAFDVSLPFGIHNAATITATPIDATTSRVAYG